MKDAFSPKYVPLLNAEDISSTNYGRGTFLCPLGALTCTQILSTTLGDRGYFPTHLTVGKISSERLTKSWTMAGEAGRGSKVKREWLLSVYMVRVNGKPLEEAFPEHPGLSRTLGRWSLPKGTFVLEKQ